MKLLRKSDFTFGLIYLAVFGIIFSFFSVTSVCAYTSGAWCGTRAERSYPMGTSPSSAGVTGTFCATGARDIYEAGKYTVKYLLDLPTPNPRSSDSTIWPQGWHWTCQSGSTSQDCYASECSNRDAVGVCTSNCNTTTLPGCGDAFVGSATDTNYDATHGHTHITDDGNPPTALDTAAERCYTNNGGTVDGAVVEGYYDQTGAGRDLYFHWGCDGPNHTPSSGSTFHHNAQFAAYKKLNAAVGARPPQLGGTATETNTATTACYPSNLNKPTVTGQTMLQPTIPQVTSQSEDAYYYYWTCGGVHGGTAAAGSYRKSYTITPSASTGCNISPNTAQTVQSGNSSTFTMSAQGGYQVSGYQVDGGATTSGTSRTFSDVTANHTVRAICSLGPCSVNSFTATSGGNTVSADGTLNLTGVGTVAVTFGGSSSYASSTIIRYGDLSSTTSTVPGTFNYAAPTTFGTTYIYNATYSCTGGNGNTDTRTITINVSAPSPTCSCTLGRTGPDANGKVDFTINKVITNNISGTTKLWTLFYESLGGSLQKNVTSLAADSYTYGYGTYTPTLKGQIIQDSSGNEVYSCNCDSGTFSRIQPFQCVPEPVNGKTPLAVKVSATGGTGTSFTYTMDYPLGRDNTVITTGKREVYHTYKATGTTTYTVLVTSNTGYSDTCTVTVTPKKTEDGGETTP